ncbi:hypothetical protein FZC84_17840 [Rossellomorea vietnamensis]|uniref:Uncharacterized protein n=1 Tax=Rossellomorea vietnamensis TaxID=218284 RepID=A0A5D4M9S0_9BACI|nr:hypothetical protein [Rossellomorea vietnamensis]TYR97710.1 hypothetical protein FZC84_17840 [Rossellomorea vietnamensis]
MLLYLSFVLITGVCLVLALKKRKIAFLAIPFLTLFGYGVAQVILVPLPFIDTVRFIFSLS